MTSRVSSSSLLHLGGESERVETGCVRVCVCVLKRSGDSFGPRCGITIGLCYDQLTITGHLLVMRLAVCQNGTLSAQGNQGRSVPASDNSFA